MSQTFFTSDTHYFHKNIIRHTGRPFTEVEEMNEAMVTRWNSTVKDDDVVWHLGDFSFGDKKQTEGILKRLKGRLRFIRGNHDNVFEKYDYLYSYFEEVADYKRIVINGQPIILSHYPILSWHGAHKGSWHLHGHCHSSIDYLNTDTTRLDVGVDGHGFFPISYEEVAGIMYNKSYKVVDHHGKG